MPRSALHALSATLAGFYADVGDIKRIADEAGLRLEFIVFEGSAVSMWYNVLAMAEKSVGATRSMLTIVRREYPESRDLERLQEEYDAALRERTINMGLEYLNPGGSGSSGGNGRVDKLADGFSDMRVSMAHMTSKLDSVSTHVSEVKQNLEERTKGLQSQLNFVKWLLIAYGIGLIVIAMAVLAVLEVY